LDFANQRISLLDQPDGVNRVTLDTTSNLKTTASERDSTTGFSGTTSSSIDIGVYDLIDASITVTGEDTGSTSYSGTIVWEAYDGSWNTVASHSFSAPNNDSVTRTFSGRFENYTQFRARLATQSGTSGSIQDYGATARIAEFRATKAGVSILAGALALSDFPEDADDESLSTNQVYLEPDGSGDYTVKVKG
jgi:hypothetical protein